MKYKVSVWLEEDGFTEEYDEDIHGNIEDFMENTDEMIGRYFEDIIHGKVEIFDDDGKIISTRSIGS